MRLPQSVRRSKIYMQHWCIESQHRVCGAVKLHQRHQNPITTSTFRLTSRPARRHPQPTPVHWICSCRSRSPLLRIDFVIGAPHSAAMRFIACIALTLSAVHGQSDVSKLLSQGLSGALAAFEPVAEADKNAILTATAQVLARHVRCLFLTRR